MSDMFEHPLAAVASRATTSRIYLPAKFKPGQTNDEKSEQCAHRPEVAALADMYFNDSDRLAGDRLSAVTLQQERPIHRIMIYLHAQGSSVKDIATHTGFTSQAVSNILRQPWARLRLVQILKESGGDEVKHFLTHEVAPSLTILREIRDGDIPGRTSDRLTAASAILDRALGKPTVNVKTDNTNRAVPADIQRLETEIAETRRQIEQRGQIEAHGTGTN